MKVQRHSGAGVEVREVDLTRLTERAFDDIFALFVRHGLVFIRGQRLDAPDHLAFARRFGAINVNRFFRHSEAFPEIALVVKEPAQRRNIGGGWHTDHSYDERPALGSVLVARELPSSGGDTWFVNTSDAFARLPRRLRDQLYRLRGVHSSKHVFGSRGAWVRRLVGAADVYGNSDLADSMHDVRHPAVIEHPLSGRETLYVNPGFTIGFDGWGFWRSAPLLARVYWHVRQPQNVSKFRWEPGSVAIWDNRCTWHFAQNDYPNQRRVMHRVTIEGCALAGAVPPS